ncbi:hypothetical protein MMSR116_29485 [Methylobacterium mesophilicum SR1.6/6]|uniref:Uncharacterized protein n=1 Tax=Methylobacterium mesophilicum SR1.6/6 TaxID=908290 RepID=A0A6B9FSK2_9HYPH|nr:hypothetical protein [Methylobacterium mesophilicum]QGY05570.1 hypothetical protein MMSR116_29485 [Methylobacterium mesophilicum SR1.6/6]
MSPFRLIPPDGTDWTIDAIPTPDGVELAIAFTLQGQPVTARFAMDRPGARSLSDGLRAAAGDGTMRTFPKPAEGGHG